MAFEVKPPEDLIRKRARERKQMLDAISARLTRIENMALMMVAECKDLRKKIAMEHVDATTLASGPSYRKYLDDKKDFGRGTSV